LTALRPSPNGALSASLRLALDEACRRASVILAESARKPQTEVLKQLTGLIDALPTVAPGERVEDDQGLGSIPRRYFDVLRGELLATLASGGEPVEASEVLAVLTAFETSMRSGDRTGTGHFVSRLSGVDAMNAVVEIAHDIRSPLSSILFLVDTIRRGQSGQVSPIQERQLGLVYSAALGLSTLSSDLIDAVRGERLVDGRPVPFSITETILGVCAIVEPIGEEKNLQVNVTLPAIDGRIGYPSAIHRILLNLTTNALRYTDSGSVSIGCAEHDHETVEFWVKDTGRGIPENVLAMLFDGFRPGPVGLRFSSAGLGLAICRSLLEAMGSSLGVETSSTEGTKFSFTLELKGA
jgi:signal transduction histidine kinase